MRDPVYPGYFADPFVLETGGSYFAYGTGTADPHRVFEVLSSPDLLRWTSHGTSLTRLAPKAGNEYWAPEVAAADGWFWMYYSVGHGISGHHIRVARAATPTGPFTDVGVDLTPAERFAIDPHPFQDRDGTWYLFYARDVLEHERPGTHLAVDRMSGMTALAGQPSAVLAPNADWQVFAWQRRMYGGVYDWHTLEGPTVRFRRGRYWLTYSGGSWEGDGYGVSWGVAPHPLGPWAHAPGDLPRLLETGPEYTGPGHSSVVTAPDGGDVIAFHSWDTALTRRQMHLRRLLFTEDGPRLGEPIDTRHQAPTST